MIPNILTSGRIFQDVLNDLEKIVEEEVTVSVINMWLLGVESG